MGGNGRKRTKTDIHVEGPVWLANLTFRPPTPNRCSTSLFLFAPITNPSSNTVPTLPHDTDLSIEIQRILNHGSWTRG